MEREHGASRREFLGRVAAVLALPAAQTLLLACGSSEPAGEPSPPKAEPPPPAPPPKAEPAPPPKPPPHPPITGKPDAPAPDVQGELVTDIPAMATLVASLQFRNPSEKPDQNCLGCQFYTAQEGGLGKCSLFPQGLVQETAWFQSMVKKVA